MEDTITLTETELQERIDSAVNKATEELISKHNGEMATLRKKHEIQLAKVKEESNMSAEELANKRAEELAQANAQELADLRKFKQESILKDKLAKAGLPQYFINDNRLLSAEEGELDKVIKVVKTEYDATQPSGTTHSTVVQVSGGGKPTPQPSETDRANEQMGAAISQLVK